MAYDAAEVGSLRFLAGNLMFKLTGVMLDGANDTDLDALEDAALVMDVISSYYTEQDEQFHQEWSRIQNERIQMAEQDGYIQGVHRDQDATFRFQELKAMFRSLCRKGVFVYQEPESGEWNPVA